MLLVKFIVETTTAQLQSLPKFCPKSWLEEFPSTKQHVQPAYDLPAPGTRSDDAKNFVGTDYRQAQQQRRWNHRLPMHLLYAGIVLEPLFKPNSARVPVRKRLIRHILPQKATQRFPTVFHIVDEQLVFWSSLQNKL